MNDTVQRPSTLAYPSVHLGSFEGLSLSQSSHLPATRYPMSPDDVALSSVTPLSLPPLPSLSPISPFDPLPHAPIDEHNDREAPSIDIPSTPMRSEDAPAVRDSPSMARRRTVIPASPHAARIPSGRATYDKESPKGLLFPQTLERPSPKRSLPHPPNRGSSSHQSSLPRPPAIPSYAIDRPGHASTKSASSIPIVGGLADAGPYPSASPQRSAVASNVGLGRPPSIRQLPEEVCIECMMRDRDLADVDVQGPGVWTRGSDVAWEDLKRREKELLESASSVESDNDSLPLSDDSEAARFRVAMKADKKEQDRARQREMDWHVADIGWRGFKWEEEEGLPPGFRGTKGGPLTQEAIKAVMRKFPSASAHRAKYMEHYLYHQAILVREVRAEAMRLGRYPEPGEAPSLRPDGQSIIAGPRTSSVAWHQNRRESEEQAPIGIRPSPSSPADLVHLSRPHRPQVQFTASRTADRQSMRSSLRVDPEEPWPPISSAELRPFSFAVRAGAARESNDGHGKRTVLGRWGGSVTSFFGGSQGGSGSMMDMHLGLDHDRQRRTSSNYVHNQARAVSLASPTRPSFFSRDSQFSAERAPASSHFPQDDIKKKGLKGLLSKMKPKKEIHDELVPPPSMNRLTGRDRSASTTSDAGRYGSRSVSGLQASSSSGSQSASPDSSRYNRESYAEADDRGASAVEFLATHKAHPFRPNKTSSFSNSMPSVETLPGNNPYFFGTEANRFKSLPPLPVTSPDLYRPTQTRASFDPLGDRNRREIPSPRMAQSMYVQPTGYAEAWPPVHGQSKVVKAKKGFKSFFGGAKAGRVA